jgi:ribosomal protein S18 acetylase RimI-like enzyme
MKVRKMKLKPLKERLTDGKKVMLKNLLEEYTESMLEGSEITTFHRREKGAHVKVVMANEHESLLKAIGLMQVAGPFIKEMSKSGQAPKLLALFGKQKAIESGILYVELDLFVVVLGLGTAKSEQREGLGNFLMDMLKYLFESKDFFLQVNEENKGFYEKLGFRQMEDEEEAPTPDPKLFPNAPIRMVFGLRARRFVFAQFYRFWGLNVNHLKDSDLFCPGYVGWKNKEQTEEASNNLSSMQKEHTAEQVAPLAPQVFRLNKEFEPVDSREEYAMISLSSQGISTILLALLCQPGLARDKGDGRFVVHHCVDPEWNCRPFSVKLVHTAFDLSQIGTTMLGTYLGLKPDEVREESPLTFTPFQLTEQETTPSGCCDHLMTAWAEELKPFADQVAFDTLSQFKAKFLTVPLESQSPSDVPKILVQIMQAISKQYNHFKTKGDFVQLIKSLWDMFENPGGYAITDVAIWDSIEDMVYVTKIMFGSLGFPSLAALGGRRRFYAINHALLGVLPVYSNNPSPKEIPSEYQLESYYQKNKCLPPTLTSTGGSVEIVLTADATTSSSALYRGYSGAIQGKASRAIPLSLADFLLAFLEDQPALFSEEYITSSALGTYRKELWKKLGDADKGTYPFLLKIPSLEDICTARSVDLRPYKANFNVRFFELFLCTRHIAGPGIQSPLRSLKQLLSNRDGVITVSEIEDELTDDGGRLWCYPNPSSTDLLKGIQWSVMIHEKLLDPVVEYMANILLVQKKNKRVECKKVYEDFVQGWIVSFLWEVLHKYGAVVEFSSNALANFPQVKKRLLPKCVDVSVTAPCTVSGGILSNLHGMASFLILWLKVDKRFRLHPNFIACGPTYVEGRSYMVKQADMAHTCPLICQHDITEESSGDESTEESSGKEPLSLMAMLQQIRTELESNSQTTNQTIEEIEDELKRENVLLLATGFPKSCCSKWTEAVRDFSGNLGDSDVRDLVCCLLTEENANVNVFTVANGQKGGMQKRTDRYYSGSFFEHDFCRNLNKHFGRIQYDKEIVFSQVILDYVWTPNEYYKLSKNPKWFQNTLVQLKDLLTDPVNGKVGGTIFLPFRVDVMMGLVDALDSLKLYYGIHFLRQNQLARCALYNGIEAINEYFPPTWKRSDWWLTIPHFKGFKEATWAEVDAVVNRIENISEVRMVCLRRLSEEEKEDGGGFQGLAPSKRKSRPPENLSDSTPSPPKKKPKSPKKNPKPLKKNPPPPKEKPTPPPKKKPKPPKPENTSKSESEGEDIGDDDHKDSPGSASKGENIDDDDDNDVGSVKITGTEVDDKKLFVQGSTLHDLGKMYCMYAFALGFWNSLVQMSKEEGVWESLQTGEKKYSDVQWLISRRFDVVPPTEFWIGFDALMPKSPAWVDEISKLYKCPTKKLERVRRGFVVSLPGSEVQEWHTDGGKVGNTSAVTALWSLQNLSEEMGGTEFSRQDPTTKSKNLVVQSVVLQAGEFIVFDIGTWHRAQANNSAKERILYYDIYSKKGLKYKDDENFDITVGPLLSWPKSDVLAASVTEAEPALVTELAVKRSKRLAQLGNTRLLRSYKD